MARDRAEAPLRGSVLDRLMAPEGGARGVFETLGVRELHQSVARDLEWLLNAKRLLDPVDGLKEASESILTYGLPDLSTYSWRNDGDAATIAEAIETAIRRFEPRLRPHTVRVTPLAGNDVSDFRLRFRIDAVLCVEPIRAPVAFDTDVDFDSSHITVRGLG